MPLFLIIGIVLAVASVLATFLMPKPKQEKRKANGLSDIDFPIASEAQEISVLRGQVKFSMPNCGWRGDFETQPVMMKQPKIFGIFGGGYKETGAFKNFVGMHLLLAHGGDFPIHLEAIQIDDKTVWTGDLVQGTSTVDVPELFGGEQKEGGYQFNFEFYGGSWTQPKSTYLQNQIGTAYTQPNHRGIAHFVQRGASSKIGKNKGGYIGTSASLKPYSFILSAYPTPHSSFNSAFANVNGDYNPAYFLYEWLTNAEWGLGKLSSDIDLPAFLEVAETLHAENIGLSVQENSARKIKDIVEDVQKLIDGVVYFERLISKFTIKLARLDYNVNDLPVLDESIVKEFIKFSRTTYSGTVNHVIIKYIDKKQNYKERVADFKNNANRMIQGEVIKTELSMYGCSNAELASRIAFREGRVYSANIASGEINCNREAHWIRPLDVFKLRRTMPDGSVDIPTTVVRAINIDDGDQLNSTVNITFVEDIFSIGNVAYPIRTEPTLPPIVSNAVNVVDVKIAEQPYAYSVDSIRIMTFAGRPNGSQLYYDLYVSQDNGVSYSLLESNVEFAPTGRTNSFVSKETNSILVIEESNFQKLSNASDEQISNGENLAIFVDTGEIFAYKTASYDTNTNLWTIDIAGYRGLLDTVPAEHSANTKILFYSYGASLPIETFANNQTLKFKFVTRSASNTLALADATVYDYTTIDRKLKPIVPANVIAVDNSNI